MMERDDGEQSFEPEMSGEDEPANLELGGELGGSPNGMSSLPRRDCNNKGLEPTSCEGDRGRKNHQHLWDEKIKQLREFKRVHGHSNVPKRGGKDEQLGRFVNNQRQHYRKRQSGLKNSLTQERIDELEEVSPQLTLINVRLFV